MLSLLSAGSRKIPESLKDVSSSSSSSMTGFARASPGCVGDDASLYGITTPMKVPETNGCRPREAWWQGVSSVANGCSIDASHAAIFEGIGVSLKIASCPGLVLGAAKRNIAKLVGVAVTHSQIPCSHRKPGRPAVAGLDASRRWFGVALVFDGCDMLASKVCTYASDSVDGLRRAKAMAVSRAMRFKWRVRCFVVLLCNCG